MRALGLIVLCAGCSSLLGIEDVTEETAPPNTVIGTAATRCLQIGGFVEQPRDLSAASIRALIPDATDPSGFRTSLGTGTTDGTFRIDNVPDGVEYTFALDNAFYVTSQHLLDLHWDMATRCDPQAAVADVATPVTLAVTGSTPAIVQTKNRPTRDSYRVASTALAYSSSLDAPVDGETGTARTLDWLTSNRFNDVPPYLVDQAAGDDLTVTHHRTTREPFSEFSPDQTMSRSVLLETMAATGVTLANGTPATVTGTYAAVTANQQLLTSIDRVLYDAAFAGSEAYNGGLSVGVNASAVPNNDGDGISLLAYDLDDWSHGASFSFYRDEPYADPFPADWERYVTVRYGTLRFFSVDDISNYGSFGGYTAALQLVGTPDLGPQITIPTNVMIGGQPFTLGGSILVADAAPIQMSWSAVSGARTYELIVSRFVVSGANTSAETIATLQTANTQIAIPAQVFGVSAFYTLRLAATVTPADYQNGELVSNGIPAVRAELASGLFRIGPTCGNGAVDSGEACDGEAMDCDRDCTRPTCGDGMVNTLAGEQCDTLEDTHGCDSDCTFNECGDGYVNYVTEDCEMPGSATCDATCHYVAECGNGMIEAPEACDGDPLTCNPDCTLFACGDGYLQSTEACDDGNTDDGDTCSSTCSLP